MYLNDRNCFNTLWLYFLMLSAILMVMLLLFPACSKPAKEQAECKRPKIIMPIKSRMQTADTAKKTNDKKPLIQEKHELHPAPVQQIIIPEINEESTVPPKSNHAAKEVKLKTPKNADLRKKSGVYQTITGDTLFTIAGKNEIYGNDIKWPSLYRLNKHKLTRLDNLNNLPQLKLPPGLSLNFITPEKAAENLRNLNDHLQAINVLSAKTDKKIIPEAIRLMNNGYLVYITNIMISGKKWFRLRVGFFRDHEHANLEIEKISRIINDKNIWVSAVTESEREQFAGY